MSKRHRGLLSKSDIRKKYHISENILGQILPPPNEYLFWYGRRIPCWKKKTVAAIMSKPEVQARIDEIKNEHLAKVQAEQLKSQKAKTSELPATCSREVGASGCEHPFIIAASLSYKLIPTNYA